MLSTVVRFALVGAVLIAAGCAERGFVTIDPAAARVGAVEPIYVATSRTASEGADIFGRERRRCSASRGSTSRCRRTASRGR